ncbi:MAG: hypothetical protein K0Q92_2609 [Steroidobacteraceae bacterium]|jgi:hypothetical protein|nr:hypothetical protein [Steroidobacteraceae bacterium]
MDPHSAKGTIGTRFVADPEVRETLFAICKPDGDARQVA